jgi:hypothetical protein
MKAEVNNENRAKFFALYWGQKVLKDVHGLNATISNMIDFEWNGWWLELKPLSSISNQDAKECGSNDSKDFLEELDSCGLTYQSHNIDYFRSKGYALPWMGLSVEEIIEAGWIKLTTVTEN